MGVSALSGQPTIVGQRGFVIITIHQVVWQGDFVISTIQQLFIKGNLLSAKYNRCVDQAGFGISRIPQLCRTWGIWHQRNAEGLKDKRDLVSAQCSRCLGQEGFVISTIQQVCRTRGIWYQHNAAGV
jgi:hypothetical protein